MRTKGMILTYITPHVTTLALGQGLAKVQAKNEAHESHFMLLRI